jgi:hypothetical protein
LSREFLKYTTSLLPLLGRKDDEERVPSNLTMDAAITDKDDLDEINKIRHMLNPNEEVFVVARQSRLKPGGSKFTPNVVLLLNITLYITIIYPTYDLWKVSV